MQKPDYPGRIAPKTRGTKLRTNSIGTITFSAPALRNFPPPEFLTETQASLWVAALADVHVEFFRARHIPMMIQYVRAVEKMMAFSDEFEEDSEDERAMAMWLKMMGVVTKLERVLGLDAKSLIEMVVRSRTQLKDSQTARRVLDAEDTEEANKREGLIYDSDESK